jgi:N-formylmaleamate deformylase
MLVHWRQNDLSVNGVRLHYSRTGHGDKPPLVFVHGFLDNGLCWTPVARDLEAEYDVIALDWSDIARCRGRETLALARRGTVQR